MKKLISLVLALAMIMMVGTVFAAGETTLPKANISIENLEDGDTVTLYKIIKWVAADDGWVFDGITVDGYATVDDLITALNGDNASNAMTALAAAVASKTAENTETLSGKTTYTYNAEVGSYLALISTNTANIYNPMVLSVNFNGDNGTGSTLNAATAATGTSGVAKKQEITLDKDVATADKKSDIAVGDTIDFKVDTVTPNYGENYTDPYFVLTDTLSVGLEMTAEQQAAIAVKVGDTSLEKGEDKDYTISTTASGYTITFTETYLHKVKANTGVTITYSATVTKNADFHQVDEFENEVTLEFSNKPTGEHGSLTDDTHHYTFSIDASVFGQSSGDDITKELKKIALDDDGNVITAWETKEANSWTKYDALAGAHFELRQGETVVRSTDSGEDGRLTFTGLDVGDYMLYETSAPSGYKYSTAGVPVKIEATYDNDGILESYTITINGENTSSYTVATNDGEHISTVTLKDEPVGMTTGLINTPAATLPSTGGIGTTIFYVLGGLLVVGAAIILVSRRKAHD